MAGKPRGTVFLGDVLRNRFTTPPSSPPPIDGGVTNMDSIDALASPPRATPGSNTSSPPAHKASPSSRRSSLAASVTAPTAPTQISAAVYVPITAPPAIPPPEIDPETSLALRVLWLETLLHGPKNTTGEPDSEKREEFNHKSKLKAGHTLMQDVSAFRTRLDGLVSSSDGIKQFLAKYDQHAALLTPAFALSGNLMDDGSPPVPGAYATLSNAELEALLTEMEPDIRAADRDLREIAALQTKGVLGAGRLAEHEALQPRLTALVAAHEEDVQTAVALERRIGKLVEDYAVHVDALSELFVDWNDSITTAELRTHKLERVHKERVRLGY